LPVRLPVAERIFGGVSDPQDQAGEAAEPVYTLDNPPPRLSYDEMAERAWQRASQLRSGTQLRLLERAPIRLYGIAERFAGGELWFLYRDAAGNRRALSPEQHDQAGIAGLFGGAEGWLCRLWPARDGGWHHERAAETLIGFSGLIGTVDAAGLGFELPPEPLPWAIAE